jgi:hypothetical protein
MRGTGNGRKSSMALIELYGSNCAKNVLDMNAGKELH